METNKKPDWTNGQPFFKWFWKTQHSSKLVLLVFTILMTAAAFQEWDSVWQLVGLESFFVAVLGIFWFKTWQHWNDLRNGTSR